MCSPRLFSSPRYETYLYNFITSTIFRQALDICQAEEVLKNDDSESALLTGKEGGVVLQ